MNLNELAHTIHRANDPWWRDPATGIRITRNRGELLGLIHSELCEMADGEFQNAMDDKLPQRRMGEVECADALIRALDYAAGLGYDLNASALAIGIQEFDTINSLATAALRHYFHDVFLRGSALLHSRVAAITELERRQLHEQVPAALVDLVLTIATYAARQGYDLHGAYLDKMAYNATRADHQLKNRLAAGGKKF